jgi:peptidoglycan-associated lipoprotein
MEWMLPRSRLSLLAATVTVALLGVAALGAEPPRPRPTTAIKTRRVRARPTPRPEPTPRPTPTPRPPDPEYDRLNRMSTDEIDRLNLLPPVYFDEARAEIRDVDKPVLEQNAAVLKRFDFLMVSLEAHCDARGDADYNMRLGEERLKTVLKRLVALGVPAARLRTVSFGKEVPVCQGGDEDCLTRSRTVQFSVTGRQRE